MRRLQQAAVITGVAIIALAALLALLLSFPAGRTALVTQGLRFVLWQRGLHLSGGDITLGHHTVDIHNLRITDNRGEMFLAVRHVALDIDPAGLYGRSDRALGVSRILLEDPQMRLIRHDDGSWNFESLLQGGGRPAAPSPQSAAPAAPWRVRIMVERGYIELIDPQAVVAFARRVYIDGVSAHFSIEQGARSDGAVTATMRTLRGSTPLHGRLTEDDLVSFGQFTLDAKALPIAPLVDALAPSRVFVIERGTADVHMQAYTLGYAPRSPHTWHLSGDGTVRGAQARMIPLIAPLRDLEGRLHYQDGLLSTQGLTGVAAGVPLRAFGAIRLLGGIRLAFGIKQSGWLERERRLFAFSKDKPVSGPFNAAIRVDGPTDNIHVAGSFESRDAAYAQALIRWVRGSLYYNDGHLTASALDFASRGARVWASGDFDVNAPVVQTMLLVQARVPAAVLPLAANLDPTATVGAIAGLEGPMSSLSGSGYAQLSGGKRASLRTFFSGDVQHLTLGPMLYRALGGEIWLGASITRRQAEPMALSGEIIASNASLHVRGGRVALVDVSGLSSALPSLDTTLNGAVFVGGDGQLPDVAVDARASQLVVQGVKFGDAVLVANGRNGRVHIARATLRGGSANATAQGDLLVTPRLGVSAAILRGTATADLEAFAPAMPRLQPRGTVSGTFSAALFGTGFLALGQAHSENASIAGVGVRSGSAVVDNAGAQTSLLANVSAPGADVWAAGTISRSGASGTPTGHLEAFAPRFDLNAIKNLGTPLHAGSAVGFASVDGSLSAPDVGAAATLRSSFDNAPITGDVDLRYAGTTLRSRASRIAYAGNRATIDGSARGPSGTQADALAFDVSISEGDLSGFNRLTAKSAPLTGSFNASMRIAGSAAAPHLDGYVATDLGTIRGVAFTALRGRMHATRGAFALRGASVDLGTSEFSLDGDVSRQAFHVKALSPHVDLTDFNDFFGGADVFAGTGYFDINVASNAGALAWRGNFDLNNAALRNYPIGYIDADFSSARGALQAIAIQNGPVGASTVSGTARFRPNRSGLPDLGTAAYRVRASLQNVDLAAALPLIHQQDLGLTGSLDADGQMTGTLRNPIGTATVALHNGHFRRMPINVFSATISSDAAGVTLARSDLTLPYLSAAAQGRYWFDRERVSGKASLRAADLSSVATAMRVPGALGGSASADVSVSGTLRSPLAAASVDAGHATIYGIAFDSANVNAKYAPGSISIGDTSLVFAGKRGRLSITGDLPLQLQPLALGPKNSPVELTMVADKIDLSVLDPITRRYATLTGNLNAGASISGTAGNPIGKGTAQIRYASARSPLDTIPLTNLSADIGFDRDTISLRSLTSKKGSGTIAVQGAAHIVPAEGLRSNAGLQFWSHIGLHGAQVDIPNWIRGTLDGNLSMTRSGVTPYVEGAVAVSNAIIPFSAIYDLATGGTATKAAPQQPPGVPPLRPGHTIVYGGQVWGPKTQTLTTLVAGAPTPEPTGVALPPVDVKIALTAGNNVRVRGGNAIDLTTAGGLVIAGNLSAPTLEGQFYAVRGQVGYFDTNFRLVSGTVTFDPTAGLLPTMDVTAVTNTGGVEITLHITGRVDNLSTELTSNPPLSRDQIVATLLHAPQLATLTNSGTTPGQTQTTLTQTAQNFFNAQLSRSLLYPFESTLAQQLNIESVSFIFDAQGNLALELRKRFTSSIAAVYQTTLRVPVTQSYGVSYRLRDYLSLDLIQAQPNLALTLPSSGYATTTLNLRYQFH